MILKLSIVIVVSYLLGSIPVGLIVGRLRKGIDIREYGSGKIGGTNVMRTTGIKYGFLTLLLDGFKAGLAVVLAHWIVGDTSMIISHVFINWQLAQVIAGATAIIGHNWPIFAQFKGGRGVSAYFGTMFVMVTLAASLGTIVLAITAYKTRYMSAGSILGALTSLIITALLTILDKSPDIFLVYSLVLVLLVIYEHRDNIGRLKRRTERRL